MQISGTVRKIYCARGNYHIFMLDSMKVKDKIFRRVIFFTERKISLKLKDLFDSAKILVPRDVFMQIKNSKLNNEQQEAVIGTIRNRISILTGGPGTGKATYVKEICNSLDKMQKNYALCSPTGRAAKRLSEATGRKAQTLHRLLEYSKIGFVGKFIKNEEYPLNYDYVIVDEASMLDVFMANSLLKALKLGTSLILIGDVDQLPSVSMDNILNDLKAKKFQYSH